MNGRKARERRRAQATVPTRRRRPVHRTVPLLDARRRLVGHSCRCGCGLLLTVAGNESRPSWVREDGTVVRSKSHRRRIAARAASNPSWWRKVIGR